MSTRLLSFKSSKLLKRCALVASAVALLRIMFWSSCVCQRNHSRCVEETDSDPSFTIRPSGFCQLKSTQKVLFVAVVSAVYNLEARNIIRSTWVAEASTRNDEHGYKVLQLFFVGKSRSSEVSHKVTEEARTYNDIVQGNYFDNYANLTLKTISLFEYSTKYCSRANLVLKLDDDSYVNIPKLLEKYGSIDNTSVLVGQPIFGSRPIRDPENKWYISKKEYPNDIYPNYLSGGGYLMSNSVVKNIYEVCKVAKVFPFEDLMFTGLCAPKAGIYPKADLLFNHTNHDWHECYLETMICVHPLETSVLQTVWTKIMKVRNKKTVC